MREILQQQILYETKNEIKNDRIKLICRLVNFIIAFFFNIIYICNKKLNCLTKTKKNIQQQQQNELKVEIYMPRWVNLYYIE